MTIHSDARCWSCRFWRPPIAAEHRYANHNPNCGQCCNTRLYDETMERDGVSAEGHALWVGPEFFCAHHEAK